MTLTSYDRLSSDAKKLDSNLRIKLLRALTKTPSYVGTNLQTLQNTYSNTSTASIVVSTYLYAKQYEEIDAIQDEIVKGNGRTEQELETQASRAHLFAAVVMANPLIKQYATLLTNVNSTLLNYALLEKSDDRIHDAIGDLLSSLLDYAQSCADEYETFRPFTLDDMRKILKSRIIDLSDPQAWTKSYASDITDLQDQYNLMLRRLSDPGTLEEIVKFITNREIGSYGSAYIPDLSSPLLVSVLPDAISAQTIQDIWRARLGSLSPDALDSHIANIDDSQTTALSRSFATSISTNSLSNHRENLIKRSTHKTSTGNTDDDNAASGIGMSFASIPTGKSQGKRNNRKGKRKGDESPIPSSSGQQQQQAPSVPDDSQYEPDTLLASKARTMTEKVQAQAASDLSHDHMSRFGTTVEVASSIPKTQLKPKDSRIQIKDRNGTRFYLVTYTRKSRKPIFSPIL